MAKLKKTLTPEQPAAATPNINKPSVGFRDTQVATLDDVTPPEGGEKRTWLRGFSSRMQDAAALAAIRRALPSIQEGQLYLSTSDGRYLGVQGMHLPLAKLYWTQKRWNGESFDLLAVQTHAPADIYKSPLRSDVRGIAVCYGDDGEVYAALLSFDGPASPFFRALATATNEAGGRWKSIVGTPQYTRKTGSKGFGYTEITASIESINAEAATRLTSWLNRDEAMDEVDSLKEAFTEMIGELDKLAAEGQTDAF